MTIVYGEVKVEGAVNANPLFYDKPNLSFDKVMTDDDKIARDYQEIGVEVSPITKKRSRAKK